MLLTGDGIALMDERSRGARLVNICSLNFILIDISFQLDLYELLKYGFLFEL